MSGHSKWHSIKHKKAAVDAKRGKIFTKLIKEIQVAAKIGGSDESSNPRLRTAVQTARDANMPKDTIERAVKKGAGELEGVSYQDIVVEGYGQAGVAIYVEGTTDNVNRTMPELRKIFSKGGGQMGEQGCVGWMFNKKGVIIINGEGLEEETVMETALEAGAEDFEAEDGMFRVEAEWTEISDVRAKIEAAGINVESSNVENVPSNSIAVESVEDAKKLMNLLEQIEDHDDVNNVSANFDISDEIMAQIEE